MRYESVIGQRHRSQWPSRLLSVAASEGHWCIVAMQLCTGGYQRSDTWNGTDPASFWRAIRLDTTRRKALSIISANTQRSWDFLRLYPMLEADEFRIYPEGLTVDNWVSLAYEAVASNKKEERPVLKAGELRTWLTRNTGMLIISDPPTILRGWLKDCPCTITWTDFANYGILLSPCVCNVEATADDGSAVASRLNSYAEEFLDGSYGLTAGRLAFNGWTVGYRHPGCVVHGSDQVIRLERSAYLAGRAECYRIGPVEPALYYLDATAAYAFHARESAVPVRVIGRMGDSASRTRYRPRSPANAIGDVTLRTTVPIWPCRVTTNTTGTIAHPVVGSKHEDNGLVQLLTFPTGTFRTILPGPELELAVRMGVILQWHDWVEYDCEPALTGIATAILKWRAKANDVGDPLMLSASKALYRHLIGHLAKRNCAWLPVDSTDNDVYYGEWYGADANGIPVRYRSIAGQLELETDAGFAAETLPAASAWINSYQRLQLWDWMQTARAEHVYYCDTDGIMVDERGKENLHKAGMVRNGTVGSLGVRWGPCRVSLRGIKHYEFDGFVVCAGQPPGCEEVPRPDGTVERVETGSEAVKRRRRPSYRVKQVDVIKTALYRHGVVTADGWVYPYELG